MKKIIDILMTILIALSYFSYGTKRGIQINLGYFFQFYVGAVFILLLALVYAQTKKKFRKDNIKGFVLMMVPEIVAMIYTLIISIIFNYIKTYMSRRMSNMLLYFFPIIEAFCILYVYKERGLELIFKGTILNYTIYIIIYIAQYGIGSLFQTLYLSIFQNTDIMTILEAHQVTFVLGLFFIYYMNNPKKNKWKIAISLLYLLLGFKRILAVGIVVALLVEFIMKKIKNKNIVNATITVSGILFIIVSYLWVYGIKTGVVETISDEESIDFMSRFTLYERVAELYEVRPTFLGKGVGYISIWTQQNYDSTIGLHSDLLKKYIEYGFLLYGLYFYYKFIYVAKKLYAHTNNKNLITYMALNVLTFICYFTDNVGGYYMYLLAFNTIVMYLFNKEENV